MSCETQYIFGKAISVPGNSPESKAQLIFSQHLAALGVNAADWVLKGQNTAAHASFLVYEKRSSNRQVVFSTIKFRFSSDGKLERIQMKDYGNAPAGISPSLSISAAEQLIAQDLTDVVVSEKTVDADWVWFPVPASEGYRLRPAYPFNVKGQGKHLPADLKGYIDAENGQVLYRQNKVKDIIDRTIKGEVYKQNPTLPATVEPLADLAITINGITYYTDTAGVFSDALLMAPIAATVKLQGKWAKVNNVNNAGGTPNFPDTINLNGGQFLFPTLAPSSERHVNAYYHVTRVHDFMKGYYPSFTDMDFALPTNVDVTGSCNAFYNGSSINFYAAGGGCNSFANCGDIIYHEYGHGINDNFYNWQGAGTMNNGALNEGEADIWALSITHDPVLGKGSTPNGGMIRRYDLAPKVYPQDLIGEVHADGEIIAGAWWDLGVNLNDPSLMTEIFAKTFYDTPDGADGDEGDVYHQVLISALINDDNDGDLNNGTPHFTEIVTAFAKHGIYLLGNADIIHEEVANPEANTPVVVNADVIVATPGFLGDVKLFFRDRAAGVWDSLVMTGAGSSYSATMPGFAEGTIVDYYLALFDNSNVRGATAPNGYLPTVPQNTVTIPYQFGVGIGKSFGFDFETAVTGWTIGNAPTDNASAGKWTIAKPIGSFVNTAAGQLMVQTNADYTPSMNDTGRCLVTGNSSSANLPVGSADVDNGKTSVITQEFDLTGMTEPVLEYFRWYSNDMGSNPGEDTWIVQAKNVLSSNWSFIENTKKADATWRRRILAVRKTAGLTTADKIMLQFVANDAGAGGSIIEAAVDDIFIYDLKSVLSVGDNAQAFRANIFPNPANEEIMVELAQQGDGYIALYDLTGKQISKMDTHKAGVYRISTVSVAPGTYFLTVKTEHAVESRKISVIH
ncbi:MAG: T9SS type A sorting domain-containing protein [Sphingobacteriales bacterium]|nr:MAG: T9SS type A sorting domain-containing protein [Sphingobacteriales bacterium]